MGKDVQERVHREQAGRAVLLLSSLKWQVVSALGVEKRSSESLDKPQGETSEPWNTQALQSLDGRTTVLWLCLRNTSLVAA